jgi:broad specificity phosphatase PhoE
MYEIDLILARHGSTDANARGIIQGTGESPLSEVGLKQAACMACWAKARSVTLVYSSAARRASETARIIADHLAVQVIISNDLRERCYGPYEGLTRQELLALRAARGCSSPDPTQDWFGIPEVESDENVWKRVAPVIDGIISSGKKSLVVTHAGVIKSVLYSILSIPPKRMLAFKIPNGSMLSFRCIAKYLEMVELCQDPCAVSSELTVEQK